MDKIRVNLNKKSYDILVGSKIINELEKYLSQNSYSKIFVITDENIAKLHNNKLTNALQNFEFSQIIVKSGENSKSFASFQKIAEEILSQNIDRKSLIIACGGGVVGDLSGFVASVLLRGIDFIQIPTTLLSAVDSSVGGKTAINSQAGKNLIGSFYQPKLVLCDLDFIKTLPKREILAGYAEILKYGLIIDHEFFNDLEQNYQKIFDLDENFLTKSILKSCQIKAKIVEQDEREKGLRALLNFGHTFAHSFETETNYDGRLNHGEAVGIGMLMASEMSYNLKFLSDNEFNRIKAHIENSGLNFNLKSIKNNWDIKKLTANLYKDKKTENNNLNFILLNKIGEAFIEKNIDEKEFVKVTEKFI